MPIQRNTKGKEIANSVASLKTNMSTQGPVTYGLKLESRLNIKDLESVKEAFMKAGEGYDGKLRVDKDTFCDLMQKMISQGSGDEFVDLFDKIDVSKEGVIDWDKFASHLLLQYSEKDDRVKSTQVPQWKDIKNLPSPHKDVIQKVVYLKSTSRYLAISKEGSISTWDIHLHLQKSIKQVNNDSVKPRDMWVTNFVVLQNLNKIALSFTSKEIVFYDLSSKLEFNIQYRVYGLESTPLSMDYWGNPQNPNEAILVMGDTAGNVNAFVFSSTSIALFDRPHQSNSDGQDQVVNVNFKHLIKDKFKYCRLVRHQDHKEWARQVKYAQHLDCFISCSTTTNNAMVLGWIEKARQRMKTSAFNIAQGLNAFDYHDTLNLIATAGVNSHVCLWNPYVVSKPVGLLRGHMAPVIHVQFNYGRGQLISFSKDKVLRIWDVQLQVCLQRIAGMFPKGPELSTYMFFHEDHSRLFMTFNYQITFLEMKPEVKDRILSHDKPVSCAIYSTRCNQVFSGCHNSVVNVWMLDTGQKVKQFLDCHGNSEITAMALDLNETRLFTGSTDGTVKVWDFNGHCHHTLYAGMGSPADISQVVVLKRGLVVIGWDRHVTVFHNGQFNQCHIQPADWKGRQEHQDDILAATFSQPDTLATASYDGEIVIWNTGSETLSRHLKQRCYRKSKSKEKLKAPLKSEPTSLLLKSVSQSANQVTVSLSPSQLMSMGQSPRPQLIDRISHMRSQSVKPGSEATSRNSEKHNSQDVSLYRPVSRASVSSEDEQTDFIVTRLVFLDARKGQTTGEEANLVSCGGNGWVRFWNFNQSTLLAEFVAHSNVAVIVMAVSEDNKYLVTGDTEGLIKVWNIQDYCQPPIQDHIIMKPPVMIATWQPHNDTIESLVICVRNERTLVISGSMDCSVQVWDVYGNHIGTFGQEEHWSIDPYVPPPNIPDTDNEMNNKTEARCSPSPHGTLGVEDTTDYVAMETEEIDEKEMDPLSKVNTWEKTRLGKQYQEKRMNKRERKQPGTIPDLPYLNWEKAGQPPSGPFAPPLPPPTEKPILPLWTQALAVPELDVIGTLRKPDFITHPHRYFADREDVAMTTTEDDNFPLTVNDVKQQFDERSLFPKYILEYEARMKAQHRAELNEGEEGSGRGTKLKGSKSRFRSWGTVASTTSSIANISQVGKSSMAQSKPPARLSPLPERKKLHLEQVMQEMI